MISLWKVHKYIIETIKSTKNGLIYVVDAHFIDKIEEKKMLDPNACGFSKPIINTTIHVRLRDGKTNEEAYVT